MWFAPLNSKGVPPHIMCKLGETAGSISDRLTLPKLHLATLNIGPDVIRHLYTNFASPARLDFFLLSHTNKYFIIGDLLSASNHLSI